jgi:hypothetical protein
VSKRTRSIRSLPTLADCSFDQIAAISPVGARMLLPDTTGSDRTGEPPP